MTEADFLKKQETKIVPKTEPSKTEPKTEPSLRVLANKQDIRERKKPHKQRNSEKQEGTTASVIGKIAELPLKIKIGPILVIILAFFLYANRFQSLLPGGNHGESSLFFQKFGGATKSTFEEINNVELPASDAIMEHTVSCRKVANMIKHSPAFGDHGPQIEYGLLGFGEKITVTGRNLQNMYIKGASVYKSFDIEIKEMRDRLNSARKQGDTLFFKESIRKLITNIREFRKAVDKTQSSIHDAEEIRHDTEGYIVDGLRVAEKYVGSHESNSRHAVDLANAEKELKFVSNVLEDLRSTAGHLDKMKKILMNYEDRLLDVEVELDNGDADSDGLFEVTNQDLSYLEEAVDRSKACLYKFNQLSS